MNEELKNDYERKKRQRVMTAIIIFLVAFIVGLPSFGYFKIETEGRTALREAKNIKIAFQMLSVEGYGRNQSIYDAQSASGMANGIEDRLKEVIENDGSVYLKKYNKKTHTVEEFVYESGHYRVLYQLKPNKQDDWRVDYYLTIFDYGGEK